MLKHSEDRNNLHCKLHATKLHLLNRVFPCAISNLKQKKYKPWKNVAPLSFPQRFVSFNQGTQAAHTRWIYKLPHVLILFCILRDYESLYKGLCVTNSIKLSKRRNYRHKPFMTWNWVCCFLFLCNLGSIFGGLLWYCDLLFVRCCLPT